MGACCASDRIDRLTELIITDEVHDWERKMSI